MPQRAARLLFQLPRQCRVFCKIQPANQWGWPEVLLNKVTHGLDIIAWQKTKDAQKKRGIPKMFMPDFMKQAVQKPEISRESEAHTVDDIKAILARARQ